MPPFPERLQQLAAKARALPKVPGVYLMKDEHGRVLYVGKALVLPHRVSTYFQPSTYFATPTSGGNTLGPKKQPMLDLIADFDIIPCDGEWEALLTENRLIKDLHPRFNARLTDDKTFPYLVITTREDFPGIYITRDLSNENFRGGAKILGPFTSVYALRHSINLLQKVFRFRTCELEIDAADPKLRFFRPCILHAIKRCSAPCAARIDKAAYRADIDRFIRFIESKRSVMLRQMRDEMAEASKQLQFEKAASLRDQIHAIEQLDQRGKRSAHWQPEAEAAFVDPRKGLAAIAKALNVDRQLRSIECFDIAHLQGEQTVASKVCFMDGRPMKNAYRRFRITTAANDDFASMREAVSRAYRDAGAGSGVYPDLVLIDGGPAQLSAALESIADYPHQPPLIIALAKKEEEIHRPNHPDPLKLSRHNLGLKLIQAVRDEAHRFAQHYHHLLRKKKTLEE